MELTTDNLIVNSCEYTPVYLIPSTSVTQAGSYIIAQNTQDSHKPVTDNLKRYYENSGNLENGILSSPKPRILKKQSTAVVGNNLKLASFLMPKTECVNLPVKQYIAPVSNVVLKPAVTTVSTSVVNTVPRVEVDRKIVHIGSIPLTTRAPHYGRILTKKPKENTTPNPSKHTSVQLLKLGETYHSLNQLSDAQMKIVNQALKIFSDPEKIPKEPAYDPVTNTKFIYKVVSPRDLTVVGKNKVAMKNKKNEVKKLEKEDSDTDNAEKSPTEPKVTRSGRTVRLPKQIVPDETPHKPRKKSGSMVTCFQCSAEFCSLYRLQRHYENNPTHIPAKTHTNLFHCLLAIIKGSSGQDQANIFVQQLEQLIDKLKTLLPCLMKIDGCEENLCTINDDIGKLFDINPGKYNLNMGALNCVKTKEGFCVHNPAPRNNQFSSDIKPSQIWLSKHNEEIANNESVTEDCARTNSVDKWPTISKRIWKHKPQKTEKINAKKMRLASESDQVIELGIDDLVTYCNPEQSEMNITQNKNVPILENGREIEGVVEQVGKKNWKMKQQKLQKINATKKVILASENCQQLIDLAIDDLVTFCEPEESAINIAQNRSTLLEDKKENKGGDQVGKRVWKHKQHKTLKINAKAATPNANGEEIIDLGIEDLVTFCKPEDSVRNVAQNNSLPSLDDTNKCEDDMEQVNKKNWKHKQQKLGNVNGKPLKELDIEDIVTFGKPEESDVNVTENNGISLLDGEKENEDIVEQVNSRIWKQRQPISENNSMRMTLAPENGELIKLGINELVTFCEPDESPTDIIHNKSMPLLENRKENEDIVEQTTAEETSTSIEDQSKRPKAAHIQFRSTHFDIRSSPIKPSALLRKFQINPDKLSKFEVQTMRPLTLDDARESDDAIVDVEMETNSPTSLQLQSMFTDDDNSKNNDMNTDLHFDNSKLWAIAEGSNVEQSHETYMKSNILFETGLTPVKNNLIEPSLIHLKNEPSVLYEPCSKSNNLMEPILIQTKSNGLIDSSLLHLKDKPNGLFEPTPIHVQSESNCLMPTLLQTKGDSLIEPSFLHLKEKTNGFFEPSPIHVKTKSNGLIESLIYTKDTSNLFEPSLIQLKDKSNEIFETALSRVKERANNLFEPTLINKSNKNSLIGSPSMEAKEKSDLFETVLAHRKDDRLIESGIIDMKDRSNNSIEHDLLHLKDVKTSANMDINESDHMNTHDNNRLISNQGHSVLNFLETLGNELAYPETEIRNNTVDFQLDLFSFNNS